MPAYLRALRVEERLETLRRVAQEENATEDTRGVFERFNDDPEIVEQAREEHVLSGLLSLPDAEALPEAIATHRFGREAAGESASEGRDIVIVVGRTGAGKSTFINGTLGASLRLQEHCGADRLCLTGRESVDGPLIGHSVSMSETVEARAYRIPGSRELHLVDTAGTSESRGVEQDILGRLSIDNAVRACRTLVGVLAVFDEAELTCNRMTGFTSFLNEIRRSFYPNDPVARARKLIGFVVTIKRRVTDPIGELGDICNRIRTAYEEAQCSRDSAGKHTTRLRRAKLSEAVELWRGVVALVDRGRVFLSAAGAESEGRKVRAVLNEAHAGVSADINLQGPVYSGPLLDIALRAEFLSRAERLALQIGSLRRLRGEAPTPVADSVLQDSREREVEYARSLEELERQLAVLRVDSAGAEDDRQQVDPRELKARRKKSLRRRKTDRVRAEKELNKNAKRLKELDVETVLEVNPQYLVRYRKDGRVRLNGLNAEEADLQWILIQNKEAALSEAPQGKTVRRRDWPKVTEYEGKFVRTVWIEHYDQFVPSRVGSLDPAGFLGEAELLAAEGQRGFVVESQNNRLMGAALDEDSGKLLWTIEEDHRADAAAIPKLTIKEQKSRSLHYHVTIAHLKEEVARLQNDVEGRRQAEKDGEFAVEVATVLENALLATEGAGGTISKRETTLQLVVQKSKLKQMVTFYKDQKETLLRENEKKRREGTAAAWMLEQESTRRIVKVLERWAIDARADDPEAGKRLGVDIENLGKFVPTRSELKQRNDGTYDDVDWEEI